jgi:hypothetical protein
MPPSGGIVVSAAGFSTAAVDVLRQSLWTSTLPYLSIKHLLRAGQELRTAGRCVSRHLHALGGAVFHNDCGCLLYKPVDNDDSLPAGGHLPRIDDFLPSPTEAATAITLAAPVPAGD